MEHEHIEHGRGEPPAEWPEHFQGLARIQTLPNPFTEGGPAIFAVHFDAGGRSRPHSHRDGQMLLVTSGRGLVGDRSGRRAVGPGDVVVMAGNVMIFLAPGTEAMVVANMAGHLAPGGALVAGFSLEPGRLDLATYDAHAAAAGLALVERWATWDRQPFDGGNYAVSVHRSGSSG